MTDDFSNPKTWEGKVIKVTRGNQTLMGAILIAIINPYMIKNPPRFDDQGAQIDSEGIIFARFQAKDGRWHAKYIFHAIEFGQQLNRVADQAKLSDHERLAMFAEAQKWIVRDFRTDKLQMERLQ